MNASILSNIEGDLSREEIKHAMTGEPKCVYIFQSHIGWNFGKLNMMDKIRQAKRFLLYRQYNQMDCGHIGLQQVIENRVEIE